jgi:hypothetical protein
MPDVPDDKDSGIDPRKWFESASIISFTIIATFCVLLFWWSYRPPTLSTEQKDVLMMLMQVMNTAVVGVIAYFLKKD